MNDRDLVAPHEHHLDDGQERDEHERERQRQLDGGLAAIMRGLSRSGS